MVDIKTGNYRLRILALLFMATTINYFDRSIINALAPTLSNLFDWTDRDYAKITISFKIAYAIGLLTMGGVIDKMGTKKGYILSIVIWSIFGMLHVLILKTFSLIGFIIARFGLGFGESGNFPACIKAVAEWFPKKERAFATGIFNAATSVGAILAPVVVALIVSDNGQNWQIPFLITGGLSGVWIFLWWKTYRKPGDHPKVGKSELLYINSDSVEETTEKIPWRKMFLVKQTWGFSLAKIPDAVWWFYLFWSGKYLYSQFGLNIKELALPLIIIYILADFGSIFGGFLSSYFIKKGWTVNRARKTTLFICALVVLPVMFAAVTDNQWISVVLIGLGAAGHQAWSANAFTLVSDVFPKKAVASVVGIGGMVGAVSGILADFFLGEVLMSSGKSGYFFAFMIAGMVYLVVLGVIQLIMPKLNPLGDEDLLSK